MLIQPWLLQWLQVKWCFCLPNLTTILFRDKENAPESRPKIVGVIGVLISFYLLKGSVGCNIALDVMIEIGNFRIRCWGWDDPSNESVIFYNISVGFRSFIQFQFLLELTFYRNCSINIFRNRDLMVLSSLFILQ